MPVRTSDAQWEGDLQSGKGTMRLGSGAFEGQYSFASRFESGTGTNPEELIAAAHASCFSMALASQLANAESIDTTAHVVRGVTSVFVTRLIAADTPPSGRSPIPAARDRRSSFGAGASEYHRIGHPPCGAKRLRLHDVKGA